MNIYELAVLPLKPFLMEEVNCAKFLFHLRDDCKHQRLKDTLLKCLVQIDMLHDLSLGVGGCHLGSKDR